MNDSQKNTKKYLIVLILRILESKTDAEHPITQTQIAKEISELYPCDRKTVCRNIKFLKEMGYPIVKTTKGFYMDKKTFSKDEIDFVKQAITLSDGKSDEEKATLLEKVVAFLMCIMLITSEVK